MRGNMSRNTGVQQIVDGWADSSFENTPDGVLQYLKYRYPGRIKP
jgi:hypothetical protein